MPRFLVGDELGSIKFVQYDGQGHTVEPETLRPAGDTKQKAVQRLATLPAAGSREQHAVAASAHADGSATLYDLSGDTPSILHEWTEPRLKAGQKYIGLTLGASGVFSCTSNGALRLTNAGSGDEPSSRTGILPMRLSEWRLSPDEKSFAYAGEEVELSIWDVEKAFSETRPVPTSQAKKRKRGEDLFPGETWRARNLPNDFLGLRSPTRNTCLSYISPYSQTSIVVGTFTGDIKRYDTRSQRRPVANWEKIGKINGISALIAGHHEHELFASDGGCNLYCVDSRNGQIVYGYHGIAGAITSASSSPGILASSSRDRYVRIHSIVSLAEPGKNQNEKGQVLEKTYFPSIPTAVVWDQDPSKSSVVRTNAGPGSDCDSSDDDVESLWEGMQGVDDEGNRDTLKRRRGSKQA